ncbi:hypothetical protein E2I00_004248, partial [Balaenoptera physalus]
AGGASVLNTAPHPWLTAMSHTRVPAPEATTPSPQGRSGTLLVRMNSCSNLEEHDKQKNVETCQSPRTPAVADLGILSTTALPSAPSLSAHFALGCPELSAGPDMPRRRRSSCAQQVAPEGLPGGGDRRLRDPLLPRLPLPELRAASGAGASGGSRASEGGAEWWEAPASSSASQHQRGVSEHSGSPPQCPRYSFLPDLGGQSLYFKNSLKKILLHHIPALGPFRRDHSQFTTVEKTNQCVMGGWGPTLHRPPSSRPCSPTTTRGKAQGTAGGVALSACGLRMRRYGTQRSATGNAAVQGILENRTASGSAASEQVFGSVGRWLESLPKALYPRAKEDTMANSFGWDFPGLSTLEPKGHLSEDTSMNSSLPFIPRGSGGTSKPFWSRWANRPVPGARS